jgi:hypothetical protein
MGPNAGVDLNLTLFVSRVDSNTCTMGIGNGHPYARVDLN